jgi:hypothetical protein
MTPYAASSVGGGSVRRKLTRRATQKPRYEEEEEGYVSGEYEDGPFELVKIRVKVRTIGSPTFLSPSYPFLPSFIIRMTFGEWP